MLEEGLSLREVCLPLEGACLPMLWAGLRQMVGRWLLEELKKAWLPAGNAPGTWSKDPAPLEPMEEVEPGGRGREIEHSKTRTKYEHSNSVTVVVSVSVKVT